eukprot:5494189-Pyramimonas_sp.AAC.1
MPQGGFEHAVINVRQLAFVKDGKNKNIVLDYSSTAVPPPGTQPMTEKELDDFLQKEVAINGRMSGCECICRLREGSVFMYITAAQ